VLIYVDKKMSEIDCIFAVISNSLLAKTPRCLFSRRGRKKVA